MYDDSDGKVLLLAAVEHRNPSPSCAALNHRERLQRTLSSAGPGSIRASASSFSSAPGCGGGAKGKAKVAEEAYVHVEVFPDDDYRFTIDCHLLVLAETQAAAEDLIFNFEVPYTTTGRLFSAVSSGRPHLRC